MPTTPRLPAPKVFVLPDVIPTEAVPQPPAAGAAEDAIYTAAESSPTPPAPDLNRSARTWSNAEAARTLLRPVVAPRADAVVPVAATSPRGFTEREVAEFMAQHPQNQTKALSNGHSVMLPMQIKDMEVMQIIGTVKANVLNKYLEPHGVEMVTAPFTNVGTAALTIINYKDTSIGPYQELVVGVFVRDKKNPLKTGFYMIKLYVTSEMSQVVGREVWGFPKDLANVTLDPTAEKHQGFSVNIGADIIASGKWNKHLPLPSWLPGHQTAVTPTQWVGFVSKYKGMKMGAAIGDTVQFSPGTEWGKLFTEAGFKPRVWMGAPHGMGVIKAPK